MARSKAEIGMMVSGGALLLNIMNRILTAARVAGATDDDIHRLSTPKGDETLAEIGKTIAGKTAEVTVAVQVAWSTIFAWLIGMCRFTYVNPAITAEHFPCQPGDFVATEVVIVKITKVMSTKDVLALLDKQGLRPATLVELLWWWFTHPTEQKNCLVVALGSVWGSSVPFVNGVGDYRGLSLGTVEGDWDGGYAFAGVRKSKAA